MVWNCLCRGLQVSQGEKALDYPESANRSVPPMHGIRAQVDDVGHRLCLFCFILSLLGAMQVAGDENRKTVRFWSSGCAYGSGNGFDAWLGESVVSHVCWDVWNSGMEFKKTKDRLAAASGMADRMFFYGITVKNSSIWGGNMVY